MALIMYHDEKALDAMKRKKKEDDKKSSKWRAPASTPNLVVDQPHDCHVN